MSEHAVLVFVSAGNCGACIKFKQNSWETTKKDLQALSGVKIVEAALASTIDPLPPTVPADLSRFVSWYPTFILTTRSSYERGKIEGVVFNGVLNKNNRYDLVPLGDRRPTDAKSVVAWVKEQLGTPMFKGKLLEPLGVKGVNGKTKPKPIISSGKALIDEEDMAIPSGYCQRSFLPFS